MNTANADVNTVEALEAIWANSPAPVESGLVLA